MDYDIEVIQINPMNFNAATGHVQTDSLVAKLKLGNQWCFDSGFFITAEWIGYEIPLYSRSSSGSTTLSNNPDAERSLTDANRRIETLLSNRGSVASQIAFGFAF